MSATKLTCLYPDGGTAGCTGRKIYVRVAGQTTTDDVPLCYLAIGEAILRTRGTTTPVSDMTVSEGATTGQS